MRLFNRRKEMEFDDPRLVGMSPLKTTENCGQSNLNLPTLKVEQCGEGPSLTGNKFNDRQPDKHMIPNGGPSSWRRVARPWDSLRRSESTEALGRSAVMSSTMNRRKTLHFYSELDDKSTEKCKPNVPESSVIPSPSHTGTLPTKRKIGRVESLRILLSKSNRIYRGKQNTNSKIDKGTGTEDLENDIDSSLFNYPDENDEVFHSKYSSFSSLKSGSCFLPNSLSDKNIRRRLDITKTISCENLSLKPENQGITLPGHKDMSTSTSSTAPLSGISYLSQTNSLETTSPAKRSSFPYAYIRSRLTSLQEEPKKPSTVKSTTTLNRDDENIQSQDQKQKCSLASKFMHKGFYHSMGNLLSESKDESNRSPGEDEMEEDVGVDTEAVGRIFDPLKQIRIDLLHRNPSELDDQSPSPTFWGRRSYSIGDMLEKRKGSKDGVEESGYDSDSTRNGHESPRNSIKLQSENENEPDQSPEEVQSCNTNNNDSSSTQPAFDSQSQSSNESSGSSSTYLFPAAGCVITINQSPNDRRESISKSMSVNQGSSNDLIQPTDADFYSASRGEGHESEDGNCSARPVTIDYKRESGSGLELQVKSNRLPNNSEKSRTTVEVSDGSPLNYPLPSIRMEMTDFHKRTAPSLRLRNKVRDRDREWNVSRPSRSKSLCLSIFTVAFNKGPKKKSLGFSVIGGKDSPVPGIFVKRIFPYGQACEEGGLTEGDEILSVNGLPLANSTHAEALQIFKSIKTGEVILEVARREFLPTNSQNLKRQYSQLSSKSCEQLHRAY